MNQMTDVAPEASLDALVDPLDVLIVGAGISGVAAARYLRVERPGDRFAVSIQRFVAKYGHCLSQVLRSDTHDFIDGGDSLIDFQCTVFSKRAHSIFDGFSFDSAGFGSADDERFDFIVYRQHFIDAHSTDVTRSALLAANRPIEFDVIKPRLHRQAPVRHASE